MKRIKALIFALEDWVGIPRLPKALFNAGFDVVAICPEKSYLCYTRYLDHFYALQKDKLDAIVLLTLKTVLERWEPDLIIPGDEKTIRYLITIITLLEAGHKLEVPFTEKMFLLLKKTMVSSVFFEAIKRKSVMHNLVESIGIPAPKQIDITCVDNILQYMTGFNFPVILKSDIGTSGEGVFICKNEQELQENYEKAKNTIKEKNYSTKNNISLQEFITGNIYLFWSRYSY